jgi:transposase
MRGRKARAIEGINEYDFARLAKTDGTPRERRRFLAFAHIQDGKSLTEAAKAVKAPLRTLMAWVKKFREKKIDGLRDPGQGGAKPKLPYDANQAFREAVLELQANRPGGRIKGKDVHELMTKKFGIKLCPASVYNALKRVDLVWITGRSQHPKADIEKQETFKKTSKKKY